MFPEAHSFDYPEIRKKQNKTKQENKGKQSTHYYNKLTGKQKANICDGGGAGGAGEQVSVRMA